MLVEIAIGDAYGAAFEYAPPALDRPNDTQRYYKHPKHMIGEGRYTDDTQMSIAVAEAMLEDARLPKELLARKFVECFHRDPRVGYAGRFYEFLRKTKTGQEFLDQIIPDSDKSGGAMRACPIGYYPTFDGVMTMAERQASLTHNTPDGIHAAQAAALMAHYFIYGVGTKDELGEFLMQSVPGRNWDTAYVGEVGSKGLDAVHAAVTAVAQSNSLRDILHKAVAFGGDVDTVAAIAMGAASQSVWIVPDLPDSLYENLESGTYGRSYLDALSQKLHARFRI